MEHCYINTSLVLWSVSPLILNSLFHLVLYLVTSSCRLDHFNISSMLPFSFLFIDKEWQLDHKFMRSFFIYWRLFNHCPLGLIQLEQDGELNFSRWEFLADWQTYSNSLTVLVIWQKIFNEKCGVQRPPIKLIQLHLSFHSGFNLTFQARI